MTNLQHTLIRGVGGASAGASVITALGSLLSLTVSPVVLAFFAVAAAVGGLMFSGDDAADKADGVAAE